MTSRETWLKPAVIRKIRLRVNFILCIVLLLVLYLNHSWLMSLFVNIFQ
ncbi:MAG: hypothetical protein QM791_13200 [Ferruginibacter sp.]